ncbi:MAG: penicillin-binding protein activator, partial [Pseudomonadales bacterium]|nr:penicillin-binding protein activator [Pseudomonadales bacterium]
SDFSKKLPTLASYISLLKVLLTVRQGIPLIFKQCMNNQAKFHFALQRQSWLAALCVVIAACGSSVETPEPELSEIPLSPAAEIRTLVRQAEASSGFRSATLFIQAAEEFLAEELIRDAANTLQRIEDIESQAASVRLRYAMAQARIARASGDMAAAMRWLTGNLTAGADNSTADGAATFKLLGDYYQDQNQHISALRAYTEVTPYFSSRLESDVFDRAWRSLQQIADPALQNLADSAASYELRGWIELERVYRTAEFSIRSQLDAIAQWQRVWSSHSASNRLPQALAELQSVWSSRPRHIALILPTQQQSGLTIQEGFFSAYYQALDSTREVPRVTVFDSSDVNDVFSVYDQAVAAQADLIIGPLNKDLVNQLSARQALPVTTLALNYLDPGQSVPENLYQFGLAPEDEIAQLANLAWQAGHRNVALFTPASADYLRLRNEFSRNWEQRGGNIVSTTDFTDTTDYSETVKRLMAVDSSETRAERILDLLPRNSIEFTPRRRQDIDFIFLIANPRQGRLIKPTLAFYFAENVPVYSMPSIYEGVRNPNEDRDLNGIWFADAPWILEPSGTLKEAVNDNLRSASGPLQRLRALGVDSFRLYARLQQLAEGNLLQVPGATGVLTMAPNQSIHRSLRVARFVNGQAEEQAVSASSSD